eukprot:5229-Ditylum_brightwellii.AAC.1
MAAQQARGPEAEEEMTAETGSSQTQAEPEQEDGEGDLLTQPPQEEATPEPEAPDTEQVAEAPPQGSTAVHNMEEGWISQRQNGRRPMNGSSVSMETLCTATMACTSQ